MVFKFGETYSYLEDPHSKTFKSVDILQKIVNNISSVLSLCITVHAFSFCSRDLNSCLVFSQKFRFCNTNVI